MSVKNRITFGLTFLPFGILVLLAIVAWIGAGDAVNPMVMTCIGAVAVCSLVFPIRFFFGMKRAYVPRVQQAEIAAFQARLPKDFGYPYWLDNTGYGINVDKGKIYLENKGTHKIYNRAEIREIQLERPVWQEVTGASVFSMGDALLNQKNRKDAFEASGIFIRVADTTHPRWQIKTSDPALADRCHEILQQFRDGELKPYGE